MSEPESDFSHDVLRGANEIAEFLFGSKAVRRKVYHLASTSNMPVFKLGSMICARKSVLLAWVEAQERHHANDNLKLGGKAVKAV